MLASQVEPRDSTEYEFTFAESAIDAGPELEIKLTADDTAVTLLCRDCGKIYDGEEALGCGCFVCETCALERVATED